MTAKSGKVVSVGACFALACIGISIFFGLLLLTLWKSVGCEEEETMAVGTRNRDRVLRVQNDHVDMTCRKRAKI